MDALELAKQLEAKVRAGSPTKVTREFIRQFEFVCDYYGCSPEEVELMKEVARKDMENAKICFASIYGLVK